MNPNRVDISVDLETYDTAPTGAILSIGACRIDPNGGPPTDHFYRIISLESNQALNRTESKSTVSWWNRQSEEARKIFTEPSIPLEQALKEFREYIGLMGYFKDTFMWGNGSDFDNVMIISAYKDVAISPPWPFYNNRCFRTFRKELGHLITEPDRAGTHHNALDDAIYQGEILTLLLQALSNVSAD